MFGGFSLEQFRQAVVESCSSETEHLIVSYSRKAVQQTGDGHFSPIGGYNNTRDLVLLLDVVSEAEDSMREGKWEGWLIGDC